MEWIVDFLVFYLALMIPIRLKWITFSFKDIGHVSVIILFTRVIIPTINLFIFYANSIRPEVFAKAVAFHELVFLQSCLVSYLPAIFTAGVSIWILNNQKSLFRHLAYL